MRKLLIMLMGLLVLLTMGSCSATGAEETAAEDMQPFFSFTDDLERRVDVTSADRVAVMIGSFADVWCLAGGHDSIVAAADDSWTSFDLGLDESVSNLGAIKTPNLEALLQSRPDLVIASCNTASNLDLMDTLEGAGITVAYFDVQHFEDYLRMLDVCCSITGCRENYSLYGESIVAQIAAATDLQDGSAPTVLCLRATGSSCSAKKSTDNLLGEMLADLGCVNVADGGAMGLESLSMEAIMEADPDYIFAVLQGSDSSAAKKTLDATLLTNPAWSGLRAVREGNFHTLENSLFNLKPNARWGEAYAELAGILYE